ncbi:hypothetical protein GCM10027592_47440 [Spirosoma flavus]
MGLVCNRRLGYTKLFQNLNYLLFHTVLFPFSFNLLYAYTIGFVVTLVYTLAIF